MSRVVKEVMLRSCFVVVATLSAVSASMAAQNTPTERVRAALTALAQRDWGALASLVDSEALESLRQDALGMLILTTEQRLAGQEVGGGYNPNEVIIAEHLPRVGNERVSRFPKQPTIAELASLSPRDFFIKWAEAVYGNKVQNDPVSEVVELYRRIIGEVKDSPDRAYVLYRRESREIEMGELKVNLLGRVKVMPVVRTGGDWRIRFNDDIGWSIDFSRISHPEGRYRSSKIKIPPRISPPEPAAPPPDRLVARPSPVEVVQSIFRAFAARDWQALSALVDAPTLRSFQQRQISYLSMWIQSREARGRAKREGLAFVMYSYEDSLPPEALAEVATLEVPAFQRHHRIGELAALAPAEFFREWCAAAYTTQKEGFGAWKSGFDRETIGQVFESGNLAWVLYRSSRGRSPDLMPVRWGEGGWRSLLNDDIGWQGDLDLDRLDR
jgi:hypothetical protein